MGTTLVVVALASYSVEGWTFQGDGKWSAANEILSQAAEGSGGGIAGLVDGRGFVDVQVGASPMIVDSFWSNGWSPSGTLGSGSVNYTSAPARTSTNVYVATAESPTSVNPGGVCLDTYYIAMNASTGDQPIGLNDPAARPAIAPTMSGDLLVVVAPSVGTDGYDWTLRTSATWSPPTAVPEITPSPNGRFDFPVLTTRTGVDAIVGVFEVAIDESGSATLGSRTFSNGAWGPLLPITTGVRFGAPASVAALSDGRLALAYASASSTELLVGFFDGSAWGAFTVVPGIAPARFFMPAVAAGLRGDVVELVYLDTNQTIHHTALTNETTWTWSSPDTVATGATYTGVFAATP